MVVAEAGEAARPEKARIKGTTKTTPHRNLTNAFILEILRAWCVGLSSSGAYGQPACQTSVNEVPDGLRGPGLTFTVEPLAISKAIVEGSKIDPLRPLPTTVASVNVVE